MTASRGGRRPRRTIVSIRGRAGRVVGWLRKRQWCHIAWAGTTASRSRRANGHGPSASSASRCDASRARSKTVAAPMTSWCPGSRSRPGESPDPQLIAAAIAGADLVIVDNIASLPLNLAAAHAVSRAVDTTPARVSVASPRSAVAAPPPCALGDRVPAAYSRRAARDRQPALTPRAASARLRVRVRHPQLLRPRRLGRRPRRDARRVRIRRRRDRVCSSPRAIERKNVPGRRALRAAGWRSSPGASVRYWLSGPAEDGYEATLDRILERSRGTGDARPRGHRRGRLRGVRRHRLPVHVGGLRQPDDRVDRGAPAAAPRSRIPCSRRSCPPACVCSRPKRRSSS